MTRAGRHAGASEERPHPGATDNPGRRRQDPIGDLAGGLPAGAPRQPAPPPAGADPDRRITGLGYRASSRRTMAAPWASAFSLPKAISRGRYFMPQSGAATS